ncbi:UDP-N-acetylmuramoyl-L-alanine--D-glutamate ligase [Limnobacter sp.]|uniref:UDP-N-acetylmuramoyl-L-alanine--D-glutamate ligase n=1 Tax=Limnobacter sp. TaxID=2003368 RepID=UPI0035177112
MNNQWVLQVGLGESGLACARWSLSQGARVTVIDTREHPPGLVELRAQWPEVQCVNSLDGMDWTFTKVVVSPGLAPAHPLMQTVASCARQHGVELDSELDLFADALADLQARQNYSPKVLGVTGTNGKTTTTRMAACLAEFAGHTVVAAGNISPAALEALRLALENETLPEVWVLELSSFQLHWTKRLRLHASTVLNLSQDHLDWHTSMEEYAQDKFRIFTEGAACVLNRDDPVVMGAVLHESCRKITFGLNAPTALDEFGLLREGGMLWLAQTQGDEEAAGTRKKKQQPIEVHQKMLMPTEALQVAGLHNAANAMAALALCVAVGMPMARLLHGLRSYQGEPHRVQHVLQIEGVDYFDDSKGTNVGATVAALNGLARPTVLIAGGDGKGQDFNPLQQPVAAHCKAVMLIGKDADAIAQALSPTGVPCHRFNALAETVAASHALCQPGDVVLLSPACASLDMFKNYVHRAEVFVDAVRELASDRGQPC